MQTLDTHDLVVRIGSALILGALVGIERERKHRPAGFRTMILISLGSCGFVLLGVQALEHMDRDALTAAGSSGSGQAQISRIVQGLIGGIGFLGAGAVIQNKRAVRGITTAAAVWVVAAIGAACGLGLWQLAWLLAIATLFTLVVLEFVEDRYFPEPPEDEEKGKAEKKKSKKDDGDDAGDGPAMLRGEDGEKG